MADRYPSGQLAAKSQLAECPWLAGKDVINDCALEQIRDTELDASPITVGRQNAALEPTSVQLLVYFVGIIPTPPVHV
jgi:hypothetical protein